ncbi:hypothetical protein [Chitinophaga filiformis]|uniref:Uncharacterized protein n=1 Tax=Chitinophaga filiformis TaxID=104663 RepID=A0ABY4HUU1_CHIFI|nr:hypothetical protein [Chitinophaga filiformis]UPK67367.1 hypothetical protein MYF79_20715 [Chitinophaga filiformis]
MSAFNVLITDVQCLNCRRQYSGRIQFKYGNAAFLQYHIGDTVKWGRNNIGNSDFKKVNVYGIAEADSCPLCDSDKIIEEFDIFIEDNVIIRITPMESIGLYLEGGSSEYVVMEMQIVPLFFRV